MVDPANPNGVVKIGDINPSTGLAYGGQATATPQGTLASGPAAPAPVPTTPSGSTGNAGTLVKDPSTGAMTLAPGSDMTPVPGSGSLGSLGLPSGTAATTPQTNALGTGTTPATDPYTIFNQEIAKMLTNIQGAQTQGATNLGGAINTLTNESVSNGTPTPFNPAIGANSQVQGQQTLEQGFQPAITSLNTQLTNTNTALGTLGDTMKDTISAFAPQPVSQGQQLVAPDGSVIDNNGKIIPLGYGGSVATVNGDGTVNITGGLYSNQAGSGINPATGLTATASAPDILGYLAVNGINTTRYDQPGLIDAVENGATAQDIISGKVSVTGATAAATSGSDYQYNPITGLPQQIAPAGSAGTQTLDTGAPGGSTGSTSTSGATSVSAIQQFLVQQGFMTQAQVNTGPGIYGPQTTAAVAAFQKAAGVDTSGGGVGTFGPKTQAAAAALGFNGGSAGTQSVGSLAPTPLGSSSGIGSMAQAPAAAAPQQNNAPSNFPTPDATQGKAVYNAQSAFYTDFTSGALSDTINAQNTAVGHLVAAAQLGQQMYNISLQGGNALKNWIASATGQAAINNYEQAHILSANELSSAYGADTGSERQLQAAIGDSNSSPQQILGYVQTSASLLSSKILSNIQQYQTAYGQNAPINLNWFISPTSQAALKQIGINFVVNGSTVNVYQVNPDGTADQIY